MRQLDLQKIRKEHKVTQQRLAELTKYPQSFISQIERGRVDAPQKFLDKLSELLGINDFEPYLLPDKAEVKEVQAPAEPKQETKKDEEQSTISRLLDMLERRDQRITELENEIRTLHQQLIRLCHP